MISFPKIIQIETCIVCNSHCVFCPHHEMERGPDYMEDSVWRKIIDETRGRGILYRPFLINEPFVDKRLPEIIRYIKEDPTAKVELNSNGNFPGYADLPAFINSGIDWIRFSVDGFSDESFKASGRGGKYEKIVENVRRFIDERNRLNSKCFIEVRMIDMPENKDLQKGFVDYWSQYADKATITDLYAWPWSGQTDCHKAPCPKIREEMFFMVNGQAILCCWDAFGRSDLGNVKTQTVEEIWLGEANQKYRSLLNQGKREEITLCSKCDAYQKYDFSKWQGY
jgi:sulfatase maturation enzyme AslB (radical SAM superfamily)